jgi:hypothetical protein
VVPSSEPPSDHVAGLASAERIAGTVHDPAGFCEGAAISASADQVSRLTCCTLMIS